MRRSLWIVAILHLVILNDNNAQVLQFGRCAQVETMRYFDIERFLGRWYEIERFPAWYENHGDCAYKTILSCGRRIEIEHGFVRDEIRYVLHVNSSYSPGDEAVFEIQANNVDPIGIPLTVISTDYTNYAIVYGCRNSTFMDVKYLSAWILSRQQAVSNEILAKARRELSSIPYANLAYLERVVQDDNGCRHRWTAHVQAEITDEFGEI